MPIVVTILIILVLWIGFEVVFNAKSVSDKDLVITFFGILATFIVVGQYSQVADIKRNFEKEMRTIRLQVKTDFGTEVQKMETKGKTHDKEVDSRIEKLTSRIDNDIFALNNKESIAAKLEKIIQFVVDKDGASKVEEALNNSRRINDVETQLSKKIAEMLPATINNGIKESLKIPNQFISYVITGPHNDLLLCLLRGEEYQCQEVMLNNGDKKKKVMVTYKDNVIRYHTPKSQEIDGVVQINGKDFKVDIMLNLIRIYEEYFGDNSDIDMSAKDRAIKQITDGVTFLFQSSTNNKA